MTPLLRTVASPVATPPPAAAVAACSVDRTRDLVIEETLASSPPQDVRRAVHEDFPVDRRDSEDAAGRDEEVSIEVARVPRSVHGVCVCIREGGGGLATIERDCLACPATDSRRLFSRGITGSRYENTNPRLFEIHGSFFWSNLATRCAAQSVDGAQSVEFSDSWSGSKAVVAVQR